MSVVSWANVDGFQKFKIMMVCLDVMMGNDEKTHYFLLDFEKLVSYHLSMNRNFLLFGGKCRVV